MQKHFWQRCFMGAIGLCLIAQPLIGAEDMSSNKNMMMCPCPMMMSSPEMTESELMQHMDAKDKATYQNLNASEKVFVLKMANIVKMNNNPMMMMQKNMMMMQQCMTMMNTMMSNMNMMDMQKK